MAKFLAGLACHFQIFFGTGSTTATHKREIQRPPSKAQHRDVNQLVFDEKLQKRHAPVKRALQHQNIYPALVVAHE